jgi:hypothetical protein
VAKSFLHRLGRQVQVPLLAPECSARLHYKNDM